MCLQYRVAKPRGMLGTWLRSAEVDVVRTKFLTNPVQTGPHQLLLNAQD